MKTSSHLVVFTALCCAILGLAVIPQSAVLAQCQDATGAPAPCPEREKIPPQPPRATAVQSPTTVPKPTAPHTATASLWGTPVLPPPPATATAPVWVTPVLPPPVPAGPSGSAGGADSNSSPSPWFFAGGGFLIGLLVGAGVASGLATPGVKHWLNPGEKDSNLLDGEGGREDEGNPEESIQFNPEELTIDKNGAWPRKTASRDVDGKTRRPDPD